MKILIVEDQKDLALEVAEFLFTEEGCVIDHAWKKSSALEKITESTYDFILLDITLPDGNGLDIINELKKFKDRRDAVIVLSARGAIDDRIAGLELGADDYLPKPFSLPELRARIHAIIRRKHQVNDNNIPVRDFSLNIQQRTFCYGNVVLNLTKKEYDILAYLVLNKNKVVARMSLTEHIWGDLYDAYVDSNFVDVHIKNLRKKLQQHAEVDWLETVRGVGYRVKL
ncbi:MULTISPECIES: response regulator transcription factor [Olivibacter]|jgi:DNA-binding response OmpR family regulator|uniref:Response regulator transcription factor n=2 Tax=Olivibacter TaxID=376469 RepID=A0ABV6HDW9_9SPHI|nr:MULTISPECIES: response regulator transcription factor [Olivibacter]MCL4637509.1 response regulator transcription factor [Olivibacter sp. UJ_SKK_5.1]MDM8177911.1 response regulator transcription factor [Olivibacter sp. 47]MDX3916184.1 response regulator transcription factor [Pseudosphingobacterium sp.]QEK99596.1 response regulator transcription factor [Olivibacter sp. LS-1]